MNSSQRKVANKHCNLRTLAKRHTPPFHRSSAKLLSLFLSSRSSIALVYIHVSRHYPSLYIPNCEKLVCYEKTAHHMYPHVHALVIKRPLAWRVCVYIIMPFGDMRATYNSVDLTFECRARFSAAVLIHIYSIYTHRASFV